MSTKTTSLTAKENFTLRIEFLSDWHIGSGMGRPGDIDRLVQRDRHNLPYIPAKTVTGIWRDACERVAYGLDNGHTNGVWHQWVNYLFGDQPADPNRPVDQAEEPPIPAALSLPARAVHTATTILSIRTASLGIGPALRMEPVLSKGYLTKTSTWARPMPDSISP